MTNRRISEAVCLAFAVTCMGLSSAVLAQAPVSDLTQTNAQTRSVDASLSTQTLEERVAVLERIVQSRTSMQQGLQSQLDTMQTEVDELRGAVELHTNQLEKVLQRQRELYLEIDKRIDALKQAGSLVNTSPSGSGVQPSGSSPSQSTPSVSTGLSESDAYDAAVNLILKTREYDKAIPAFQSFLAQYPTSDFADNAHYWLGQLLFNKQQWADANQSFTTVVEQFSDSSKRPDAMLKLGVIADRQGNSQLAGTWYDRLLSEYPNSSAAKLAEGRKN